VTEILINALDDRVERLEKWQKEINEHLGGMNYLEGTMREGIERLEKLVNKFRFAGVDDAAEAMQAIGEMKMRIIELGLRVNGLETRDPNWDKPCHSFFSED
jgi:hypothetical protein